MRIRTSNTKNGRLFYVIKTYYDSRGIEHSVTIEKLGNENQIRAKYNCNPDEWAKNYVLSLNEKEKKVQADITLDFSKTNLLSKNHRYSFNIGYLFLQSIYYRLGVDKICKEISQKHGFEYDLNAILSRLIYGRIIKPCSKSATYQFSETLLEKPEFSEHQIYRALDVIAEESNHIQQALYQNSFAMGRRNTGIIYYDCTNFFFEIEQADDEGLRKYGKSKENRPLPIVEMGMFIDCDGIPLAVCIHPGNTNEQTTLKPIEKRLLSEYKMSKFVVCTDAGLASKANRKFNDCQNRAFIVTQSLKKISNDLREWALSSDGWFKMGVGRKKYNIDTLNIDTDYESIYYKERWVDRGSFEEKLIVTYSLKYRQYQQNIRNDQIDRAIKSIENGGVKRGKYNQNDYRRFVSRQTVTEEGEAAEIDSYFLNTEKIKDEARYDGFYAVVSNLDDDPSAIIKVNQQRWQIEECFRIMKSEFKARPAYVQNDTRIEAHFLTCFVSLIIYRYLEKKLNGKFTCDNIISTLQDMHVREVMGSGYIPTFTRTELTDTLHDTFGFRTDYQIISKKDMKKIIKFSKSKI